MRVGPVQHKSWDYDYLTIGFAELANGYDRWLGGGDWFGGGMPAGQNAISEAFVDSGGNSDVIGHFDSPAPLDPPAVWPDSSGFGYSGSTLGSTLSVGHRWWHNPPDAFGSYPQWYWTDRLTYSLWRFPSLNDIKGFLGTYPTTDPAPGTGNTRMEMPVYLGTAQLPDTVTLHVPWVADANRQTGTLRAFAQVVPYGSSVAPLNWPDSFATSLPSPWVLVGSQAYDASLDGFHDLTLDFTLLDKSPLSSWPVNQQPCVVIAWTADHAWIDLPSGDSDPAVMYESCNFDFSHSIGGVSGTTSCHYEVAWAWVGGSFDDGGPDGGGQTTVLAYNDEGGGHIAVVQATNPVVELSNTPWPFGGSTSSWVPLGLVFYDQLNSGTGGYDVVNYPNELLTDPGGADTHIALSTATINDGSDSSFVRATANVAGPYNVDGSRVHPITMWCTWGPITPISGVRTIQVTARLRVTVSSQDPGQSAGSTSVMLGIVHGDATTLTYTETSAHAVVADGTWQDLVFTYTLDPTVQHINADGLWCARMILWWPYATVVDISEFAVAVSDVSSGVPDATGIVGMARPLGRSGRRLVFIMSGFDDPTVGANGLVTYGGNTDGGGIGGTGTTPPITGGATGTTISSISSTVTVTDSPSVQDEGYVAGVAT